VGQLVVVDRDFVELSNLQRQFLFEEADATAGTPKAIAAAQAVSASTQGSRCDRGGRRGAGKCRGHRRWR